MQQSPEAIRYIDPSWNRSSPNGLLYPSIFYLFGARRIMGSGIDPDAAEEKSEMSQDDALVGIDN